MSYDRIQLIRHLYDCFNARDVDGVLEVLSDDVCWANGMDGGHEQGREAVRAYWTRQWALVSPHVEPVEFQVQNEDTVMVEVVQTVFDLNGHPLQGQQNHDLKDKIVTHIFHMEGDEIVRFDISDAVSS